MAKKNANPPIECPSCRKMFTPNRTTTRYCSPRCRQAAHRSRHPGVDRMDYQERIMRMIGDAMFSGRTEELKSILSDAIQHPHLAERHTPKAKPAKDHYELKLRRQMQQHHPDRGGDPAKFRAASEEWKRAKAKRSA